MLMVNNHKLYFITTYNIFKYCSILYFIIGSNKLLEVIIMKKRLVRFSERNEEQLEEIKQAMGCLDDSETLRLALGVAHKKITGVATEQ